MTPYAWPPRRWPKPDARARRSCASRSASCPATAGLGTAAPPPDPAFLEQAWAAVADAARQAGIAVVLGTERITDRGLLITALVVNSDGSIAGWQDKVQIDPSEEAIYAAAGSERHGLQRRPADVRRRRSATKGWRYPETVRWAARRGAQVVFHPHAHVAEPGSYRPTDLCRSGQHLPREGGAVPGRREHRLLRHGQLRQRRIAERPPRSCRPDGTVLCWQPYGQDGLLVADLDLSRGDWPARLALPDCAVTPPDSASPTPRAGVWHQQPADAARRPGTADPTDDADRDR